MLSVTDPVFLVDIGGHFLKDARDLLPIIVIDNPQETGVDWHIQLRNSQHFLSHIENLPARKKQ